MKPSWDDAPEWANWLAMNSGGIWHWHERMPGEMGGSWQQVGGYIQEAVPRHDGWDIFLERRL